MKKIFFYYVIGQLLFLTSSVEPLSGTKVVSAESRDFSFIASLQFPNGQHFCSGTVITNKHVITATHCLNSVYPDNVKIVLGVTATIRYAMASWVSYNAWATILRLQDAKGAYDVAIITLSEEMNLANVRPVTLTNLNKQQAQGKTATIVGWNGDPSNKILKKAKVDVLKDEVCERRHRLFTNKRIRSPPALLFTAADEPVLLQGGDSGGPLIDEFGHLLGVHVGVGPRSKPTWTNYTDEFLRHYNYNQHSSVPYYQQFILNVTGYE